MKHLIVTVNQTANATAQIIASQIDGESTILPLNDFKAREATDIDAIIFIGALGICVRSIFPIVKDKYTDPAVICVDSLGKNVISVLSGHIGGANNLCREIAGILGAYPVITTQSDNSGLWALDTLAKQFGWTCNAPRRLMQKAIYALINGRQMGLLIDVRDRGTEYLLRTLPSNVRVMSSIYDDDNIDVIIAVTPRLYDTITKIIYYRPKVLALGFGCRRNCTVEGVATSIEALMLTRGLSPHSLASISTIALKKDEAALAAVCKKFRIDSATIFEPKELADIKVPNPSEKVHQVTGIWGVAESSAIAAAHGGPLLVEKITVHLSDEHQFTMAVAQNLDSFPGGHIEIVGAGPGDPELVSVRGKRFLSTADLILYAGSLVPRELTHYAKPGCVVRSSASMALEEQFELMKEFYDSGRLVVRLHTGDPCIYGAIQEQMAFFDKYNMAYHITPGISSFQAAAAELRSQFTIPEKVQTIILTRGEGRTPMPPKEKLSKLAQSQSTMCIYLSAGIVDDVQQQLLEAYPPETPVAACYKLTWPDQRIYRGQLRDLAKIVHDNNLTLTTLLVVGDAIDNREGLSRLYSHQFSHLFRK